MKDYKLEPFGMYLDILSKTHGHGKVFDDFLQIIVCCLSMGRKEDLYFKTIRPYSKKEMELFSKAFASLVIQMDKRTLEDPFGDYFEKYLSNDAQGQFFTPLPICDLMRQLAGFRNIKDTPRKDNRRMLDPCCGSGRLILSAAKTDRNQYFVGIDISYTCCLMTIINMCLNSLNGEVLHQNTLSGDCWHRWLIIVDTSTKIPTVYEVEETEMNHPPTCANDLKPKPVTGLVQPVKSLPPVNFVRFTPK